jgi:hypothetical protein
MQFHICIASIPYFNRNQRGSRRTRGTRRQPRKSWMAYNQRSLMPLMPQKRISPQTNPWLADRTGMELKYFSTGLNSIFPSVNTTAQKFSCCSSVVQGSDVNQRVGRAVTAHSLRISGVIVGGQSNVALDDSFNTIRIAVLCGTPNLICTGFGVSGVLDTRSVAFLNEVLYDRVLVKTVPGRDSTGYIPWTHEFNLILPLNHLHLTYTGAGPYMSNVDIQMWMVTDSAAVPNPGFVSGTVTFIYSDI